MPYDKEELEKFRLSGHILQETRQEMKTHIKENMPLIDICEKAEELIRNKGGKPAFPVNVSINEVAAHYTAPPGETATIPQGSTVKIDIGVQIDGYVTDTAFTAAFSPEGRSMAATAEIALKTIINNIHGGMTLDKIGSLAETTIKNRGFKPISNLTGHSVGRYLIHAGTSIPSTSGYNPHKIQTGEIYAIEPFVTLPDAIARVDDYSQHTIYRFLKAKSLKTEPAKKLAKYLETNFHTLPFAERWIINLLPKEDHTKALKELLATKSIMAYPIFVEASKKPVAQAEHTLLIKEDGCEVLT
ncbi:MAG: type II methionyl aminopeptidase [Nitrososphaerota archaeon]|jgi:methionyl aminopeptidase|nr:type II methionyl aminopeptidase [Nitrososphaerota archaeon]